MITRRKLGKQTGMSRYTPACIRGLAVFAECLAERTAWLAEISADLREALSH